MRIVGNRKVFTSEQVRAYRALRNIWQKKAGPLGLTQEKAAELMGMTQGGVSHYLNGRNPLGLEMVLKFANLLQVHPSEISAEMVEPITATLKVAEDSMPYGSWEGELLHLAAQLNPEMRELALIILKSLIDRQTEQSEQAKVAS